MLDLGGATSLEVLHASVGGKAGGIPEAHGRLHAEFMLECAQRRCCVVGPVSPGASGQTILGHGSYGRDQKHRVAVSRLLMIREQIWNDIMLYNMIQYYTLWYGVKGYHLMWFEMIQIKMKSNNMRWCDIKCNRAQCVYSLFNQRNE